MSLLNDIKTLISKSEDMKFEDIKSGDLILRIADGDKFEVDTKIEQVTEAGVIALEDGEYTTVDNILVVKDGVITEVKDLVETEVKAETEDFKSISKKLKDIDFVMGVSAWIELPIGVHTIGDMTYTVEEITEDDYTYNVITEMVKVDTAATEEMEAIKLQKIQDEADKDEAIELLKTELEKTKLEFETFKSETDEVKTEIKKVKTTEDFKSLTYDEKLRLLKK